MNSFHSEIEANFGVKLRDTQGGPGAAHRRLPPAPILSQSSFYPAAGGHGVGGGQGTTPLFWDRAMYLPQGQGNQANREDSDRISMLQK